MKKRLGLFLALLLASPAIAAPELAELPLGGGATLPYYTSATPAPTAALIAIQGYTRDANRTYQAAAKAALLAGTVGTTLIIAPIFQVSAKDYPKCHFPGVPAATARDALWHCGNWSGGAAAVNAPATSFTAMDRLLRALHQNDPALRRITLAGFSAGGQYVQRYAAFSNPPGGVAMRYVVGDPSGFVYFDAWRPKPNNGTCGKFNRWKFGTENLPAALRRGAAAARLAYVAADVRYLEGGLDTGTGKAAAYALLEKNCAAELQGTYRLDRGENYAAYDKAMLAHGAHTLTIIPGCAHSVSCVFPAPAAREALFGD